MELEISDFLEMNAEELYDALITFAISGTEASAKIEELKASARYCRDYEFRAMVDFSAILNETILPLQQKELYTKRIMNFIDIIDRATALEMWQLAASAWNALAVSYHNNLMFQRALECYSHAIRIEEKHGLYKLSPVIYTNMVGIFMQIGEIEKAARFIDKAALILEEKKDSIPRYWDKYVYIYSWKLRIKIKKGHFKKEQLKPYYDKVMSVRHELIAYETKGSQLSAEFYYGFFYYPKERFENLLKKIRENMGTQQYILYCHQCIELSKLSGRDYDEYAEKLIEFEDIGNEFLSLPNIYTYNALMEYYEKKGDETNLSRCRINYIKCANKHLEELSEQHVEALDTIEQLVMSDEFKKNNNIEHIEFKLIADEAIRTRRELEKAYERIAVIGELGRKLTSTTDLNEVISAIYRVLKEHLSVDYFALFYHDEEKNALRSLAVYYKNVLQAQALIELDDETSSAAQCFKNKEVLRYNGQIDFSRRRSVFYDKSKMESCIFMPLIVANKAIGVFSIQTSEMDAYEDENLNFLKEIEPYLSIAMNNAVKSWLIEKESENRKRMQRDLEEANAILSRISSLDGLTQISSRRDFEDKFTQMIHFAKEQDQSVSVFMMDIDYFKLYNDNYGHLQGDEVLKNVAKVFERHLHPIGGLSARFGGEEFIGAALNLTKVEALQLAQEICDEIRALGIEHKFSPLQFLTVSVGVAITDHPEEGMRSKLMRVADERLYMAKASGKNAPMIGEIKKSV